MGPFLMHETQSHSLVSPRRLISSDDPMYVRTWLPDEDLNGPHMFRSSFLSFLTSVVRVVSDRQVWSPTRIAGEFWGILTNPGVQVEIIRLLRRPPFADLVHNNPRIAVKYLAPYYLLMGLTASERAACFLHHYRRLYATVRRDGLRDLLTGVVLLHEVVVEDRDRIALTLCSLNAPGDKDMEGELSLNIQVNGEVVFQLSFTIVPGSALKTKESEVLLITRVQGMKNRFTEVNLASKALKCGTPTGTLLIALHGIGSAFGVTAIAAVCAARQNCYREANAATFRKAYDESFAALGMVQDQAGLFRSVISPEETNSRSRSKHKRELKRTVSAHIAQLLFYPKEQDGPAAARIWPVQDRKRLSAQPTPVRDQDSVQGDACVGNSCSGNGGAVTS